MMPGVQALAGGARATRQHNEDRILAVVRGRLRVAVDQHAAACLRPSDALSIPARTAYTIEAMQDSEIYLYTDRTAQPELWGV